MVSGEVYTGQVVGVYNEEKFMWNPTQHSTMTVFTCSDAATTFADFRWEDYRKKTSVKSSISSVTPGGDPAIFDLTTADIVTIKLREQPANLVEYQKFLRQHHHVFHHSPVLGESWISRAWDTYHTWEDGRGNYAWDIGALNSNMMSYEYYGTKNTDFEVFGKNVLLPMGGKVVTLIRNVSNFLFIRVYMQSISSRQLIMFRT